MSNKLIGLVKVFEKENIAIIKVIRSTIPIDCRVYDGSEDFSSKKKPFIENSSNVTNPANLLKNVAPQIYE
jgi:hypothetical protein